MLAIMTNYFQAMHIKNLLEHKKTTFFLAVFWTLLIAILCLISFKKLPTVKIGGADKYVHFTFHLVFTLLWVIYFKSSNFSRIIIKALIGSIIYGILIEFAQELFTTTRKADILDVLANTSGALTAILLIYFIKKISPKKV